MRNTNLLLSSMIIQSIFFYSLSINSNKLVPLGNSFQLYFSLMLFSCWTMFFMSVVVISDIVGNDSSDGFTFNSYKLWIGGVTATRTAFLVARHVFLSISNKIILPNWRLYVLKLYQIVVVLPSSSNIYYLVMTGCRRVIIVVKYRINVRSSLFI